MNTCELLDSAKAALGLPSDYALSKWLGVTRSMMSRYRCGKDHLGDEYALKIAEALKIHPGAVLAAIHAERSKRPAVKKAWEKIARQLGTAASVFFAVFLAAVLFSAAPSPAQASAAQTVNQCLLCKIMEGSKITKGSPTVSPAPPPSQSNDDFANSNRQPAVIMDPVHWVYPIRT